MAMPFPPGDPLCSWTCTSFASIPSFLAMIAGIGAVLTAFPPRSHVMTTPQPLHRPWMYHASMFERVSRSEAGDCPKWKGACGLAHRGLKDAKRRGVKIAIGVLELEINPAPLHGCIPMTDSSGEHDIFGPGLSGVTSHPLRLFASRVGYYERRRHEHVQDSEIGLEENDARGRLNFN